MPSGGAGAVLLWTPSSLAKSSSFLTLAGGDGAVSRSHPCLLPMNLTARKRNQGKRFGAARASAEDEGEPNNTKGEKGSVDWDKAWSSFSKPSKKKSFLKFDMEQYVSRRPTPSNYPNSEEVDPLRKTERSALGVWTSLKFTYAVVGVIVGLAVYMIIVVGPPPNH